MPHDMRHDEMTPPHANRVDEAVDALMTWSATYGDLRRLSDFKTLFRAIDRLLAARMAEYTRAVRQDSEHTPVNEADPLSREGAKSFDPAQQAAFDLFWEAVMERALKELEENEAAKASEPRLDAAEDSEGDAT